MSRLLASESHTESVRVPRDMLNDGRSSSSSTSASWWPLHSVTRWDIASVHCLPSSCHVALRETCRVPVAMRPTGWPPPHVRCR